MSDFWMWSEIVQVFNQLNPFNQLVIFFGFPVIMLAVGVNLYDELLPYPLEKSFIFLSILFPLGFVVLMTYRVINDSDYKKSLSVFLSMVFVLIWGAMVYTGMTYTNNSNYLLWIFLGGGVVYCFGFLISSVFLAGEKKKDKQPLVTTQPTIQRQLESTQSEKPVKPAPKKKNSLEILEGLKQLADEKKKQPVVEQSVTEDEPDQEIARLEDYLERLRDDSP